MKISDINRRNFHALGNAEIVKGQWKPVIYTESDGNLVLFEI
jgi:hypothetical protein